jgi:transposase
VPRTTPTKLRLVSHGRLSANDYPGAEQRHCPHPTLKAGMRCPLCERGSLYREPPKQQIQLHGHAPVSALCWQVEVLRCSACKAIFNARDPQGKYDVSVSTAIVLSRYHLGLPFYRLEAFQRLLGVPLPDATQWELARALFDTVFPVIAHLIYLAAQAGLLYMDDTGGRILSLIRENKTLPSGARYGIHSTGIVSVGEQVIVLYFTGRAHAGENLDKLLDLREADRQPPIHMADASSSNGPKRHVGKTLPVHCNAHAVRKFKEIHAQFPEACDVLLGSLTAVYTIDRHTRTEGLSDTARRDYHAEHSGPLLSELKAWMEAQIEDRHVEPNSALGQAMNYLLTRWERFTEFLRTPGVPLDNNWVERILKRLILQRKNSLFFHNPRSAYVGCGLTSLIVTAQEAGINGFDYLNALQRHRFDMARHPEEWLPWNYTQRLSLVAAA